MFSEERNRLGHKSTFWNIDFIMNLPLINQQLNLYGYGSAISCKTLGSASTAVMVALSDTVCTTSYLSLYFSTRSWILDLKYNQFYPVIANALLRHLQSLFF
jgi:hypothetical protein